MSNKCTICGKTSSVFELRFTADETDAGEPWTTHVCGSCWEAIAAIANRALLSRVEHIEARINALEYYVNR